MSFAIEIPVRLISQPNCGSHSVFNHVLRVIYRMASETSIELQQYSSSYRYYCYFNGARGLDNVLKSIFFEAITKAIRHFVYFKKR